MNRRASGRALIFYAVYFQQIEHSHASTPSTTPALLLRVLQRNWQIPAKAKTVYSINCGNSELWDDATKEFVEWATKQATPYSLRYIGSMVADVHR